MASRGNQVGLCELSQKLPEYVVSDRDYNEGKYKIRSKITISKGKISNDEGYIGIEGIFPNRENFEGSVFVGLRKNYEQANVATASEKENSLYWGICKVLKNEEKALHTDDSDTLKTLLNESAKEELVE